MPPKEQCSCQWHLETTSLGNLMTFDVVPASQLHRLAQNANRELAYQSLQEAVLSGMHKAAATGGYTFVHECQPNMNYMKLSEFLTENGYSVKLHKGNNGFTRLTVSWNKVNRVDVISDTDSSASSDVAI